jgi:hypothetical protein
MANSPEKLLGSDDGDRCRIQAIDPQALLSAMTRRWRSSMLQRDHGHILLSSVYYTLQQLLAVQEF